MILEAELPIARIALDGTESERLEEAIATQADGSADRVALHATVTRTYGAMTLTFYAALLLFVIGYGLNAPTLAAMVGEVYERSGGRREAGYTLLLMAAMLGFVIGALIAGTIASRMGWREGLAATGVMMLLSAITLMRTRLPSSKAAESIRSSGSSSRYSVALTRFERRRVVAICSICLAYLVFIAAFEQWGGSFSLYVQNTTDRVVAGFEIPTLWIHSAQALFVIIIGPIMLAIWSLLKRQGWDLLPPTKMAIGLLLTALAFLVMSMTLPYRGGDLITKTSILWPLAYYWVVTFGQMAVIPIGQAFVSREAPERLASTLMGAWALFGGVGIWVSGQIGALAEPFGILAVYLGIAAGSALAGVLALSLRKQTMGLLVE
ncbi:MAG TPA: MFS transporter [Acidobacteriota bacterium]|nr:MFS transporter [Acidobacteriota bacterium]